LAGAVVGDHQDGDPGSFAHQRREVLAQTPPLLPPGRIVVPAALQRGVARGPQIPPLRLLRLTDCTLLPRLSPERRAGACPALMTRGAPGGIFLSPLLVDLTALLPQSPFFPPSRALGCPLRRRALLPAPFLRRIEHSEGRS